MEHNWEDLYQNDDTGWDIGYPSTPLKTYIDQLENKQLKILIPGAGNSYEAEYLHKNGFTNVSIIDIAPTAISNFKKRVPDFPEEKIIRGDFFTHQQSYDLIFEQTFFCAIHPSKRSNYVKTMHRLINAGGKLVGLLFDAPLNEDHPPYGGNKEMYQQFFGKHFNIDTMEACHNSIAPRAGRELFIIFSKKT